MLQYRIIRAARASVSGNHQGQSETGANLTSNLIITYCKLSSPIDIFPLVKVLAVVFEKKKKKVIKLKH